MAEETDYSTGTEAFSQSDATSEVHYNWTDITAPFMEACSELELGELLHDSK